MVKFRVFDQWATFRRPQWPQKIIVPKIYLPIFTFEDEVEILVDTLNKAL